MVIHDFNDLTQVLSASRKLFETGQYQEVLPLVDRSLAVCERHRELLYLKAAALRYLNRLEEAAFVAAELTQLHPDFGRGFQEKAHILRCAGRTNEALEAYTQAVELNNALHGSWRYLAILHLNNKNQLAANEALKNFKLLESLAKEIVAAQNFVNEGEFDKAEKILRDYLLANGDNPDAMSLLASIGIHHGILYDAEILLENALKLRSDSLQIRYLYCTVLIKRAKHQAALEQINALLKTDATDVKYQLLNADILAGIGKFNESIEIYKAILDQNKIPQSIQQHELYLSMAHSQKTVGDFDKAIQSYKKAITIRSNFGEAWWSLANLKKYVFDESEINQMIQLVDSKEIDQLDRINCYFALGKAFEDKRNYEKSFYYYDLGNKLKSSDLNFDIKSFEYIFSKQKEICTTQLFNDKKGYGVDSRDPIFIVGLPRAGSTLIEQILASHSQIEGTNELANITRITQELSGFDYRGRNADIARYPKVLQSISADYAAHLGQTYLDESKIYRTGKKYFIDKNPNNFRHIGLISLILPNAKIIDARRPALDCCFSNFKQLFANGQEFTYSQTDIGSYYNAYLDLMRHWDEVLPGKILLVHHENLVAQPEAEIARICDYLGVEFEATCLNFYENKRSVRTPSSEQVRRPLNRDGFDQWKPYEQWLSPLKSALGV